MSHTIKDLGVEKYKQWVNNIKPLDIGTCIIFKTGYVGKTQQESVAPGTKMIVHSVEHGVVNGEKIYNLASTHSTQHTRFHVQTIARWLIDGDCVIEIFQKSFVM